MSPRSRGRWDRGGDNEFEDQEGSADNLEYDDAEPGASSMDSIEEATGAGQVMGLLGEAISTVSAARTMTLSSSVLVVKEELLEILESARQVLPDELRSARWLLKEREEYLARAEREAASILEEARVQAERMVQRTEIARQAKKRAQETIEQAEANARHLQREAEDFCDRKLAAFEIALNEVGKVVKAGRDRLAVRPISMPKNEENLGETGMGTEAEAAFFDQDISDSANLQKSEYSDGFEE